MVIFCDPRDRSFVLEEWASHIYKYSLCMACCKHVVVLVVLPWLISHSVNSFLLPGAPDAILPISGRVVFFFVRSCFLCRSQLLSSLRYIQLSSSMYSTGMRSDSQPHQLNNVVPPLCCLFSSFCFLVLEVRCFLRMCIFRWVYCYVFFLLFLGGVYFMTTGLDFFIGLCQNSVPLKRISKASQITYRAPIR